MNKAFFITIRIITLSAFIFSIFSCKDMTGDVENNNAPVSWNWVVSFDSQGANKSASPESLSVESPARTMGILPEEPEKAGFEFSGWWTQVNGGGRKVTATYEVFDNITVYAAWKTKPSFTVTYDSQTGTSVSPQYTDSLTSTIESLSPDPTKTGYSFAGWFTEPSGRGNQFTANTPVGRNITVFAKWIMNVTFSSQNATIPASPRSKTVIYPETTIDSLPTAPILPGNAFLGWYTGLNGTGSLFIDSTTVTEDVTLYPKFSEPTSWHGEIVRITAVGAGTWMVPPNVYKIRVSCVGGGGGGGTGGRGTGTGYYAVGGGGGGGTNISQVLGTVLSVTPGQSIAYSVGAGGAGGSGGINKTGAAGGTTTFTGAQPGYGGGGGGIIEGGLGASGGAGACGMSGISAVLDYGAINGGGVGGTGGGAGGVGGYAYNGNGSNGQIGGGGGGAGVGSNANGNGVGGAGGPGIIIIEY